MAWKNKTSEGTAKQPPKTPTFDIREGKDGRPFALISGRSLKKGRGGINLMMFPSKFEGQFASLTLSGWGRSNFIPFSADSVEVDEENGILTIECGDWFRLQAKGENVKELVEWLNYIADLPKEKGGFQGKAGSEKKTSSWKK